jgi:hypothetical protein
LNQESAGPKRKRGRSRKPQPLTTDSNFLAQRSPTVDIVTLGTSVPCIRFDKRKSRKPRTLCRSWIPSFARRAMPWDPPNAASYIATRYDP